VTAQNARGVKAWGAEPARLIAAQITAVLADFKIDANKDRPVTRRPSRPVSCLPPRARLGRHQSCERQQFAPQKRARPLIENAFLLLDLYVHHNGAPMVVRHGQPGPNGDGAG